MFERPTARGWMHRTRRPAPIGVRAHVAGFENVRPHVGDAEGALAAAADRLTLPVGAEGGRDFNILAISGGAAGGAFGAGVLVGLTKAARRPDFTLVTGVSTGALMAPFAFLGSAWDARLTDAYTGGYAARLWRLAQLTPTHDGGLLRPEALDSLIEPFVDAEVVAAVAREHALGRRLLVASTDLDTEEACIWDMGEIASRLARRAGGPGALPEGLGGVSQLAGSVSTPVHRLRGRRDRL
jgi:predicted acylesterase/phospholipase RssA